MDASTADPRPARRLRISAGLSFVQRLRPALYALLVGSAVLAFWAGGEIGGRRPPGWAETFAPAVFGLFASIFAIYRLALVRARKYPAATGLFQVGLAVLVFVLLLPGTRRGIADGPGWDGGSDVVGALLESQDPRVRSLAAEVAGHRGATPWAPRLVELLADPEPAVGEAARTALVRLLGADPAPGRAPAEAVEPFAAALKARGLVR